MQQQKKIKITRLIAKYNYEYTCTIKLHYAHEMTNNYLFVLLQIVTFSKKFITIYLYTNNFYVDIQFYFGYNLINIRRLAKAELNVRVEITKI